MSPPHRDGRPLDRRSLLRLTAVTLVAAGCRGVGDAPTVTGPSASASAQGPRPPSRSAGAGPSAAGLPSPARYVPLPGEALPNLKQVAADFVQALTTRVQGQRPEDVLAAAAGLTARAFDPAAALRAGAPLWAEPVTTGSVVYPQLSGLVPIGPGAQQAGVMVVVRQRLLARGGSVAEVVRTCDVRLRVQQGAWRVTELASAGGQPLDRPAGLPPQAALVLDDPRIELPDTARWDVHAGLVSPDLLDVLVAAAAVAPLSVTVLRGGHPPNVFGTSRISNHTQGRAVDVWRTGGQAVVSTGAGRGPARAVLLAAAADRRTRQTGSPAGSDLDGVGRRSFTDLVHQDHLHLAVGASAAKG